MMKRITKSKRLLSLILSCALLLTGCMGNSSSDSEKETQSSIAETSSAPDSSSSSIEFEDETPSFSGINDPDLPRYMSDSVYYEMLNKIDNDKYFVENVESTYVSKEYIEALDFNSQKNIFFGYTLEELDEKFQGKRYVFTLGEDGKTAVKEFEEYQNEYLAAIKDVAIGAGVILFCVTVSAISAGAGAPAISMIFAYGAKTGTVAALSGGALGGIGAGLVKAVETGDLQEALKAAATEGAKEFKIGAIVGAITGGAAETIGLYKATLNGLTMNQAAEIQKRSKYPLEIIKEFENMKQYEICEEAHLKAVKLTIDGKKRWALLRDFDANEENLKRMLNGLAPLDPQGNAYQLHHLAQKNDATLAMLTQTEHTGGGNNTIFHDLTKTTEVHGPGNTWDKQRKKFWQAVGKNIKKVLAKVA